MAAEMETVNLVDASNSDEAVEQRTWTTRRIGLVAIALTCLVASCIAAAFALRPEKRAVNTMITGRALLQSDDMIKALAKNQMQFFPGHKEKDVIINVAKGIKHFEDQVKTERPTQWRELNELELSPEQREGTLRIVSSFNDPRVQAIGKKVLKACADGQSEGRKGVTRRLQEIFNKDELPKMRQLKAELFHGLHKEPEENSEVTFDVDSIRFLKAFPEEISDEGDRNLLSPRAPSRRLMFDEFIEHMKKFDAANPDDTSVTNAGDMGSLSEISGDSQTTEEALDFFGGLEEQARVALDQIDFVGESFGWDSKVPSEAKSGVGLLDFLTNVEDCVMRADGNDVKEGMCPAKYGSAAFDAISFLDNEMGIANARAGIDNPGGYDIWDDIFGTPAPAATGAAYGADTTSSNMFDSFFGTPAPAPAGTAAATNPLFQWG